MKSVTKTNLLFATMILAYLILSFTLGMTDISLSADVSLVLPELVLMIPGVVYIMIGKSQSVNEIEYRLPDIRQIIIIIVMVYLMMPITSLLNVLTSIGTESAGETIVNAASALPFWKMFLYVAVVPAICEEFLFRGLIYHGLRKRNKYIAMIISAFMFAMMHMNINQFSYALVIGIMFAFIVEVTGTLTSSIIMHLVFNGTSVVLSYVMTKLMNMINTESLSNTNVETKPIMELVAIVEQVVLYVGILVVAVCLLILAIRKLIRLNHKETDIRYIFSREGRHNKAAEGRFIDIFFLAGTLPAGFLMILSFVVQRL